VFERFKRAPFDNLLLGGPGETLTDFESKLHPYLRERLVGRIEIDVENSSPDAVGQAARTKIEEQTRKSAREALDRLQEAVSRGGRGAAGLDATLEALNERRVDTLLLVEGFTASGCTCPQCGCVYSLNGGSCPADGTTLDCRGDVIENAVQLAIQQSARVLFIRESDLESELRSHGSIGAVLRF
jgi:peptide subunit release factor 1 (eRF1)